MSIFHIAAIQVSLTAEGPLKKTPTIARRRAGWIAQRMGAAFEDQFVARAEFQHFNVIRIPDSCRQMRNKIVRVKSPFDFILTGTIQGMKHTAFIDVKRTNEKRFPYSSIDPHQLECLRQASFGGVAGYLIQMDWVVVFFSYEKLSKVKPRESLITADGVLLGASGHFDVMNIFKEEK